VLYYKNKKLKNCGFIRLSPYTEKCFILFYKLAIKSAPQLPKKTLIK
jgi:hypothetical protein